MLKSLINKVQDLEKEILAYFNCDLSYVEGVLDDKTDKYWEYDGDAVYWGSDPPEDYEGILEAEYVEQVTKAYTGPEYTLVISPSSMGMSDSYFIFDNAKKGAVQMEIVYE